MLYRHVSEPVWQSAGILYNWGDLYWEALKSLGFESSPDSILTILLGEEEEKRVDDDPPAYQELPPITCARFVKGCGYQHGIGLPDIIKPQGD